MNGSIHSKKKEGVIILLKTRFECILLRSAMLFQRNRSGVVVFLPNCARVLNKYFSMACDLSGSIHSYGAKRLLPLMFGCEDIYSYVQFIVSFVIVDLAICLFWGLFLFSAFLYTKGSVCDRL